MPSSDPDCKGENMPNSPARRALKPVAVSDNLTNFEHHAGVVLCRLQHALLGLLNAAEGGITKAADVERAFGVDYKLGWQVYRVATAETPLAAGAHVPVSASMKRLLTAAARRRVPSETIEQVQAAFEDFDSLVQHHAGSRDGLTALLSAFLPAEREKSELSSKQAAFRANSQIRGLATESHCVAFFLHPSEDGLMVDRGTLIAMGGVRRVRPEAQIILRTSDVLKPDARVLDLEGRQIGSPAGLQLDEFCSSPLPQLEMCTIGGAACYTVAGREVGLRSAIDFVMAEHRPSSVRRYGESNGRSLVGVMHRVESPEKRLTMDVFVHQDLYPTSRAELHMYDTVRGGTVTKANDPEREPDRLLIQESIRSLPGGLAGARLPHVPRYLEMLDYVTGKLGWNPSEFRGFRLDVHYPFYGGQYMVGFELPYAPDET